MCNVQLSLSAFGVGLNNLGTVFRVVYWRHNLSMGFNSGDNSRGPAIPIFLFIISSLRLIPTGKVIDHCDDRSKAIQFLGLLDSLDHLLNLAYSIADDRHAIKKRFWRTRSILISLLAYRLNRVSSFGGVHLCWVTEIPLVGRAENGGRIAKHWILSSSPDRPLQLPNDSVFIGRLGSFVNEISIFISILYSKKSAK